MEFEKLNKKSIQFKLNDGRRARVYPEKGWVSVTSSKGQYYEINKVARETFLHVSNNGRRMELIDHSPRVPVKDIPALLDILVTYENKNC
jgi:hypothetical protein